MQWQPYPDSIWWKTNFLTISILNSSRLGTDQVLPMCTISTVLSTYPTISLWSVSTTCTGYPCRNAEIPFETTICIKRVKILGWIFLCNFENLLAPQHVLSSQVTTISMLPTLHMWCHLQLLMIFLSVFEERKITLCFDCQALWLCDYKNTRLHIMQTTANYNLRLR